jgi:hypothetical protein
MDFEALKQIPSSATYRLLSIYSVSDLERDIEAAYAGGAHYYMIKPYSVMNLRQSLKKIMSINWRISQPAADRNHFVINEAFILPGARTRFKSES